MNSFGQPSFQLYFKNKTYTFDTVQAAYEKLEAKKLGNWAWETNYMITEVKHNILTGKRNEKVLTSGVAPCAITPCP